MKWLILVACLCGPNWAFAVQAQQQAPMKIRVPDAANVDGIDVTQNDAGNYAIKVSSGAVFLWQQTIAQLEKITPVAAGQLIMCSDCVQHTVCVSSGTGVGAWVGVASSGTFVGATWSGMTTCR